MNDNAALGEVKPISARNRQTAFRRDIDELKKWAARNVPNFFPFALLSRTGEYWLFPALDLRVKGATGDYYPLLFDLRADSKPEGDILKLFARIWELPFGKTVARLKALRQNSSPVFAPIVLPPPEKRSAEKREILFAAYAKIAGNDRRKLSALRIYRKIETVLSLLFPGEGLRLAFYYPELFNPTSFRRLLEELAARNGQEETAIRVRKWSEGPKKIRFTIEKL